VQPVDGNSPQKIKKSEGNETLFTPDRLKALQPIITEGGETFYELEWLFPTDYSKENPMSDKDFYKKPNVIRNIETNQSIVNDYGINGETTKLKCFELIKTYID